MKRVVFKISGEALKNDKSNISNEKLTKIGNDIKALYESGLEIIIICGAGNLWRGRESQIMNPVLADNIGMLGTTMNSLAIFDTLKHMQLPVTLFNSFLIDGMIDTYNVTKALRSLEKNKILIIGGGSRLPLCSTDFACVQRAIELQADTILLGKSIDGVYDKDPNKYEDAKKIDIITQEELLKNHINAGVDTLGVMDITAEALLAKYKMNILVFDVNDINSINKIIRNEELGTIIKK